MRSTSKANTDTQWVLLGRNTYGGFNKKIRLLSEIRYKVLVKI